MPNAQFIVTAHSPLVVQTTAGANLVLLHREGDHVVIDKAPTTSPTPARFHLTENRSRARAKPGRPS